MSNLVPIRLSLRTTSTPSTQLSKISVVISIASVLYRLHLLSFHLMGHIVLLRHRLKMTSPFSVLDDKGGEKGGEKK
jgi:hypothetical protein